MAFTGSLYPALSSQSQGGMLSSSGPGFGSNMVIEQPSLDSYDHSDAHIDEEIPNNDNSNELVSGPRKRKKTTLGRRKIDIRYIQDKNKRHISFSKRKAGIMKKAYELSTLTGTQVLLLVVSETGCVYTFTTPKLQPMVTRPECKELINSYLVEEPSDNNY